MSSLCGIIIYFSGFWIISTEIVLKYAYLYSLYDLDITIYLKSLILTITGLTGALIILLNFWGIPNYPNIKENKDNEIKKQKILKLLIFLCVGCTIFYIIYAFLGFDSLRVALSALILSMGFIWIYIGSKKLKSNKSNLYLTGNVISAFGCLLFLNELIIIVLRWMLGIDDLTFFETMSWIGKFSFINTYPDVKIYLDVFSISVIISISIATIIVAKKIRQNAIDNNNKINEIEKLLLRNKIKMVNPRRRKK